MRFYTGNLTSGDAPVTITSAMNVTQISVKMADSGTQTGTITGDLPIAGLTLGSITLTASDGATLSAPTPQSPVNGVTLACSSGTMQIIIGVM